MSSEWLATALLTLALHANVLLGFAWLIDRGNWWSRHPMWRETLWRSALFGALLTTSMQLALGDRLPGLVFALPDAPAIVEQGTLAASHATLTTRLREGMDHPIPQSATGELPGFLSAAPTGMTPMTITTDRDAPADLPMARNDGCGDATCVSMGPVASMARSGSADDDDADHGRTESTSWLPRWSVILFAAWLAGVLLALSRIAGMLRHLHRLVRDSAHVESGEVLHMTATLTAAAGVRRVRLATALHLDSPIVAPGRVLVLPCWALQIECDRLRAMLAHEVAHVARRDPACKLGVELMRALLWFLPFTRIAVQRLDECAELACDAWAARVLGNGRALAECLADCLQRRADSASHSEVFGLASAMADGRSPLMQRIEWLLDDQNPGGSPMTTSSRAGSMSLALTLLVVAAFALPAIGVQGALAEPALPANPELPVAPPPPAPPAPPSALSAVPQPRASPAPPPAPSDPRAPVAPPSPPEPPEPPAFPAELHGISITSDVDNGRESMVISANDATRRATASIQDRAASIQDRTASIQDHAASIQDRAASIQDRAASIQDRAASIQDHAASIHDRATSIQRRTTFTDNGDDIASHR